MKSVADPAGTRKQRWEREVLDPALRTSPERKGPFTTISGRPIERLYTAEDVAGIDYDRDDHAIEKLDGFVRAAQRVLNGYGGNVLQLTLGDKGAYLYGVFIGPIALPCAGPFLVSLLGISLGVTDAVGKIGTFLLFGLAGAAVLRRVRSRRLA